MLFYILQVFIFISICPVNDRFQRKAVVLEYLKSFGIAPPLSVPPSSPPSGFAWQEVIWTWQWSSQHICPIFYRQYATEIFAPFHTDNMQIYHLKYLLLSSRKYIQLNNFLQTICNWNFAIHPQLGAMKNEGGNKTSYGSRNQCP